MSLKCQTCRKRPAYYGLECIECYEGKETNEQG